jgi:tryptophanyl-tRNA synthetase
MSLNEPLGRPAVWRWRDNVTGQGSILTRDSVRKPRVLSGIATTGTLHIGNYIGALSVWAQEQDHYENFFMIADLHALTIPENVKADDLHQRIRETAALYIACGLDPARSVIFRQ